MRCRPFLRPVSKGLRRGLDAIKPIWGTRTLKNLHEEGNPAMACADHWGRVGPDPTHQTNPAFACVSFQWMIGRDVCGRNIPVFSELRSDQCLRRRLDDTRVLTIYT